MKKLFALLVFLLLPQLVFACGDFSGEILLPYIVVLVVLSSFSISWFFLFWKNKFAESFLQGFLLSLSGGILKGILIGFIPFWGLMLYFSTTYFCIEIPHPRQSYLSGGFLLYAFIVSIIFFFLHRKYSTSPRHRALIWFCFFAILTLLYAYGFTLPSIVNTYVSRDGTQIISPP